ncbi:Glutathione S-transferase zeta class [Glycine soja]|uniref:Glutathione S-transferase zeta class n=1 Tax=Glycine soja TaxID=3848 RepID=A0A445I556_GLYSO|nr:Glutathione S-transferase zeta class [Glycine soja]
MPLSSTQCLLSSSLGSREDASSKMKVEELQMELLNRGLSTTGTKPTLVRRLEAIFRKQTTSDGGACSPRWTRKRAKNLQNGNLSHSEEIEVAEETKDEEEEEKIVTIGKKGVVVLDQWLPDYMKTNYHVLQLGSLFLKLNPIGFVPVLVDGDSVIVDSLAIIMYLEDKYLDPPQLPHDIHQRAINFQKYIGGKVGADEKLPWTQSVIGKGFMARLQARCARKCNIRCGPGLHHGGFVVENLFLLLVQGLALGDGLFRGEDAVELLAEGMEVLVDKAHHMTIVGSGDVIVACDGCHLRRVICGGEREKERVGFELVIVGAQEEGVGRGLDAVHMLLTLLGLGLRVCVGSKVKMIV